MSCAENLSISLKFYTCSIAKKEATFIFLHAYATCKLGQPAGHALRAVNKTRLLIGRFSWGNQTTLPPPHRVLLGEFSFVLSHLITKI